MQEGMKTGPLDIMVTGSGKPTVSKAMLAQMLAYTFQPSNHKKPTYQPKNLLVTDGDAKLSAAELKRLKRQSRNIKNIK